jgi:hypothetical protein
LYNFPGAPANGAVKERARAFATMLIVTAVVELAIMLRLTSPLRRWKPRAK